MPVLGLELPMEKAMVFEHLEVAREMEHPEDSMVVQPKNLKAVYSEDSMVAH